MVLPLVCRKICYAALSLHLHCPAATLSINDPFLLSLGRLVSLYPIVNDLLNWVVFLPDSRQLRLVDRRPSFPLRSRSICFSDLVESQC